MPNQERYPLYIPRGFATEDPNLFISVNGINYLLPKGQTSHVTLAVKNEYERSLRAAETLFEKINQMKN